MPNNSASNDSACKAVLAMASTVSPLTISTVQRQLGIGYERAARCVNRARQELGILDNGFELGVYDSLIDEQELRTAMLSAGPLLAATGVGQISNNIEDAVVQAIKKIVEMPAFDIDSAHGLLVFIYADTMLTMARRGEIISLLSEAFSQSLNISINTVVRPKFGAQPVVTLILF